MSDEEPRYDVLIVSDDRQRKMPDAAARTVLRYLDTRKIALPNDEAVAQKWAEVYMEPGPMAHEPFLHAPYQGEAPVFHEAVLRFGTKSTSLDYGVDTDKVYFFLEFRGCLFQQPHGEFRKQIKDMLTFRPEIFVRNHAGLPAHREVPEDEKPESENSTAEESSGPAPAGTRVEEF